MGLKKIVYKDHQTVISAQNLNDIQDAILVLEEQLSGLGKTTWSVTLEEDVASYTIATDANGEPLNHNGDILVMIDCPATEEAGRAFIGINNGEAGANHWVGIINNVVASTPSFTSCHIHKIGSYVSTNTYRCNDVETSAGTVMAGTTVYQTEVITSVTFKVNANTSYPATLLPAGSVITIELR